MNRDRGIFLQKSKESWKTREAAEQHFCYVKMHRANGSSSKHGRAGKGMGALPWLALIRLYLGTGEGCAHSLAEKRVWRSARTTG